jgi:hypothetical protein
MFLQTTRHKLLSLSIAAALSTGCTANAWGPRTSHPHAHLLSGASSAGSFGLGIEQASADIEREPRATDGGDEDRERSISPALFWTGVIIGAVGLATLATGVGIGVSSAKKIEDGDATGLSRAARQDLVDRGELGNRVAIGGGSVLFVGGSLAAIMTAVDYSRCGPMISKKRRGECESTGSSASKSE